MEVIKLKYLFKKSIVYFAMVLICGIALFIYAQKDKLEIQNALLVSAEKSNVNISETYKEIIKDDIHNEEAKEVVSETEVETYENTEIMLNGVPISEVMRQQEEAIKGIFEKAEENARNAEEAKKYEKPAQ